MADLADSERYAIYGAAGEFGLPADDVYDDAPGSPRIAAYRTYLAQMLEVAGYAPAEAGRIADLAIAIETELHAAKLTPVEAADPRNIYNPLTFADLQAQIPELDLSLYFQETGYPLPERIILTEPRYLPVLSQMLRERPLQDFKDYAALMLILKYQGVLTTAFEEPTRALVEALTGVPVLPPREERALALITAEARSPGQPALCRGLLHRRGEGQGGRHDRAHPRDLRGAHPDPRLAVGADARRGAGKARRLHDPRRLSRHLDRLRRRRDRRRSGGQPRGDRSLRERPDAGEVRASRSTGTSSPIRARPCRSW